MRFRGAGVGHKSTRQATNFFKNDRHAVDEQKRLESTLDVIEEENDEENVQTEGLSDVADEEEDYGYQLEDERLDSEGEDSEEELEEDFGPEDDGGAVDADMEELGYAEL
jgi:hypothetical protein